MRTLIAERGSLTARLAESGPVRVRLLAQSWRRPAPDEALALGVPLRRSAWLREVILGCDLGLRVYARSVVPARSLGGIGKLPWLGARPLGEVLFSLKGVERGPIAVARLSGREPLAIQLRAYGLPARASWARRSMLSAREQRLLVTEVFIPPATALEKEAEGERGGA